MADVYKISVALAMTGNASSFFSALSQQVLHVHGQVDKLRGSLTSLNRVKLAIGGGLAIAGGTEILKILGKVESAGEKLSHATATFAAQFPAQDRAAKTATALAAAVGESGKNLNTTISGNVEAIHDLYNTVQDLDHAMHLLPAFNILQTTLSSVKDGEGAHMGSKDVAAAARAFELTGRTTTEALEKIATAFTKTTIALRGRVDGSLMLGQIQTAGAARYGWSDDFMAKGLPVLMNVMKNRTGSALNAIDNNLVGGVASSKMQMDYQEKWGLHTKADRLPGGKGYKVGSVWHADELRQDPLQWANAYREYLKARGVLVDDMKAMQTVVGEIARGNKFVKTGLDELLLPNTNKQLNKEMSNVNSVPDDAAGYLGKNDPKLIRDAFAKQWQSLQEALGNPLVEKATGYLARLTNVVRDFSQLAAANPDAVERIGKGLAILGVSMAGAGIAALLAAVGPAGWLVLGIGAIGAAAEGMKPGYLKAIASDFKDLFEGIKNLDLKRYVVALAKTFDDAWFNLPSMVAGSIVDAVANIAALIKNAIAKFWSNIGPGGGSSGNPAGDYTPGATPGAFHSTPSGVPAVKQQNASFSPGYQRPPAQQIALTIHNTTTLDGAPIARSVTRHQTAALRFTTPAGPDDYGFHRQPGAARFDAA